MKYVPRMPIPWDMVVFLTITSAGFGFSVHKLVTENHLDKSASPPREIASQGGVVVTTDLGCLERSLSRQHFKNNTGSIRLRGHFCNLTSRAMKSFDGVRIKNISNGTEGTVFLQGQDASFVTDYVALQKGRNEIEIEWRENAGAQPRKITAEVVQD